MQFVTKKQRFNSIFLTNFVFSFFPISFIIGNAALNINIVLFCLLGILQLKSKILEVKFDFPIKIIFLFFCVILFSASLSFIKSLYFGEYEYENLNRLIKSLTFFRYFLMLLIMYLLCEHDILDLKYFFLLTAFSTILVSFDVIFQYFFGFNIVGLKKISPLHNSGFFGGELITGNFIQNFSFFSIFFVFLKFKSKIYTRFLLTSAIICIVGLAILFSGNRMPLILFLLGLATVFLFRNELRKIILVSLVVLLTLATCAISYDERIKDSYYSLYSNTIGIAIWAITKKNPFKTNNIFVKKNEIETKSEAPDAKVENKNFFFFLSYNENIRLITSSLDVWSRNKIFGNGIKSFRVDCLRLFANNPKYTIDQPRSIENFLVFKTPNEESENEGVRKIGRLCSNHPHNYYIQILTETGIVGFVVISIIAFLFLNFVFKNLKFLKESNMGNFLVLACVISLFLAMFPFRTTGGFFSTSNITYIVLVSSIILSYKKKSIIKKSTNLF